MMFAVFDPSS